MAHSGFSAAGGLASGVSRRKPEPPPKVAPTPLSLTDAPLETAEQIAALLAAAIAAVARGTMDPQRGQALSVMLERQRKAIETVDTERRMAAIERELGLAKGAR